MRPRVEPGRGDGREADRGRRPRRVRWRRRAMWIGGLLLVAYAALWTVRLARPVAQARPRPFLAGPPLVFAHRGASAVLAEHTLLSYRRALADGADVLELDVRRTRDGVVIVSHDGDLGRALGVARAVADHDLASLRRAIGGAHPGADPAALLPTLEEVMRAFPTARLNVELKEDTSALADAVASVVRRAGREDAVLVASFHGDVLRRFRTSSGGRVATSASPGEVARFWVCYVLDVSCRPAYEALQIPPRLRDGWPAFRLDGEDFVDFAHAHGLAVHYWGVPDASTMRRLLVAGADGLIVDDPALAVHLRAAGAAGATRPGPEALPR